MNIKETILKQLDDEIAELQQRRDRIQALESIGEADIHVEPQIWQDKVDFNHLSHGEVVKVIQAIPGKWSKTPAASGERINYELETGGVKFRCYEGEPPPNCKIVEVLETIPAQPERTVTVRKLQCV